MMMTEKKEKFLRKQHDDKEQITELLDNVKSYSHLKIIM